MDLSFHWEYTQVYTSEPISASSSQLSSIILQYIYWRYQIIKNKSILLPWFIYSSKIFELFWSTSLMNSKIIISWHNSCFHFWCSSNHRKVVILLCTSNFLCCCITLWQLFLHQQINVILRAPQNCYSLDIFMAKLVKLLGSCDVASNNSSQVSSCHCSFETPTWSKCWNQMLMQNNIHMNMNMNM